MKRVPLSPGRLGGDGFTPSVKVQTLPASEDTWSAHTCPQRTRVTPQQAGGRDGPHRQTPLLQLHPGMLPGSPGVASCRLTGQSLRGVRASHLLDSPGSRTLQSQTLSWGSARRGTGRLGEHGLQGLWGLPGQPREAGGGPPSLEPRPCPPVSGADRAPPLRPGLCRDPAPVTS